MKKFKSVILILLITSMFFLLTGCGDTGSGEKIGSIVKVAQQGLFVKTWECQIIRGGLNNGGGVVGQAFDFTVEDPKLVERVQVYLNNQQEVKIRYRMEAITWLRSESRGYFLVSIEPLGAVTQVNPNKLEVIPTPTPELRPVVKVESSSETDAIREQNKLLMKLLEQMSKK